jgi:putative SOS response-associated peptidase YedK
MGYFEWLKKSNKERIPHFTKRADGKIMLLAGLWDSVKYEGIHTFLGGVKSQGWMSGCIRIRLSPLTLRNLCRFYMIACRSF